MDMLVISKELIKPSSPSIHHLQPFKLSVFDQLFPTTYSPSVFFYPANKTHLNSAQISTQLKTSLSQTLSTLYPLSGRLKDNFFIDNYDAGVPCIETRVKSGLFDFLKQSIPQLESLNQFLPCQPFRNEPDPEQTPQVAVQVNIFDCGGIALGVCLSHKITDGATAKTFLDMWAANTRGSFHEKTINPNAFQASLRFPPQSQSALRNYLPMLEKRLFKDVGKSCVRRFVFDDEAVKALRAKSQSKRVDNPSRTEAIGSFIWKSCTDAARVLSASPRPSLSCHAVNIRQRAEPCLPKHSIGNLWLRGFAACDVADTNKGLKDLVSLTRETFETFTADYLKSMEGEKGFETIAKSLEQMAQVIKSKNPETFSFTNWLFFHYTDIDFGWGKPMWVGVSGEVGAPSFMNTTCFKKTGWNNDTEAWMILDENMMSIVENDPEFLKYASPNPALEI